MDPELEEQIRKSTAELKDLYTEAGVEIDYFVADWKQMEDHMRDVAGGVNSHPGWSMYYFEPYHLFEDGGVDSHITLLTSKPIERELAEKMVNLVINLGADVE